MALLDFGYWFFTALEEDGQMPILLAALFEAILAGVFAIVVHHFTDKRDLERRVDRLEVFAERQEEAMHDVRRTLAEWEE